MASSSKATGKTGPFALNDLGSAFAVAGQIPEALFELLGAQAMLTMAGEDRLDGRLLIDLVDDDDARSLHLGLTEGSTLWCNSSRVAIGATLSTCLRRGRRGGVCGKSPA